MAKLFFMDKDVFDLSKSPIPFEVTQFDLDKVDVIHTASNPSFDMGGGRDSFLKKEYDCSFNKELELQGKILSIISVDDNRQSSKELVKTAYCKYFAYCKENNLKNIGVVGLGCGIGGLSKEDTIECLIKALDYEFCIGYKCFDKNMKCRDIQFEENKSFHQEGEIKICNNGFHFCKKASDVFNYYNFDKENIVCSVRGFGNFDFKKDKICFQNIEIYNSIDWYNLLDMINTGNWNTGNGNTGDSNTGNGNTGSRNTGSRNTGNWNTGSRNTGSRNTGNWNTGSSNTGSRNTGDWNTGDGNTGDWNTGDGNTGNCNTGYGNTGNWNTGNGNTGDWNSCNNSSGFFCTTTKNFIFNKETDIDIREITYPLFLFFDINNNNYKESVIQSFINASTDDVKLFINLPNFDYDIVEEIFGITREMIENKLK